VVSARLRDLRDGRIEEMDAAGIDIAVLSHTIGGVEGISDPAVAASTARRVNDFLAAEVADSGGRFAGFATIAPRILREYETQHDQHQPDRSLDSAATLNRYPNRSILSSTVSEDTLASAA
jgi:predicted TIM-barrel fold metal-dependent hydrolase